MILGESPSNSTEGLITKNPPLEESDGGWFSKPPKDEDATEPDWVTLTWRSKLPRFLPFSLLIPGEQCSLPAASLVYIVFIRGGKTKSSG